MRIEARSSKKIRPGGYVTGCLWSFLPTYIVPEKIDEMEDVMRLQAPRDGVAIIIRMEPWEHS